MKLRDLPKFKKEIIQPFASKHQDSFFASGRSISTLSLSTMEGMPIDEVAQIIHDQIIYLRKEIGRGSYYKGTKELEAKELLTEIEVLYSALQMEIDSLK